MADSPKWTDIVAASAVIVSTTLSIYNFVKGFIDNRPKWIINLNDKLPLLGNDGPLIFKVWFINIGKIGILLEDSGFILPDSSKISFPSLVIEMGKMPEMPEVRKWINPGASGENWIILTDLKRQLAERGCVGRVNLQVYFADATRKVFKSKKFLIDLQEPN